MHRQPTTYVMYIQTKYLSIPRIFQIELSIITLTYSYAFPFDSSEFARGSCGCARISGLRVRDERKQTRKNRGANHRPDFTMRCTCETRDLEPSMCENKCDRVFDGERRSRRRVQDGQLFVADIYVERVGGNVFVLCVCVCDHIIRIGDVHIYIHVCVHIFTFSHSSGAQAQPSSHPAWQFVFVCVCKYACLSYITLDGIMFVRVCLCVSVLMWCVCVSLVS